MDVNLKRQSWLMVFVINLLTLGVYNSFWFKKKILILTNNKKIAAIHGKFSVLFILIAILYALSGIINYKYGVGFKINISIIRFGLGYNFSSIFSMLYWVFVIYFSFILRKYLSLIFKKDDINPLLTLFLGPLYLQYKINKYIDNDKI